MTNDAAIFRAQLGAALRSLPSELQSPRSDQRAGGGSANVSQQLYSLAAQLDESSPGLALMMQLRRRLFVDAAGAAHRRGFDAIVAVGWGFVCGSALHADWTPLGVTDTYEGAAALIRLVLVDHPAVFTAAQEHGYHQPRGALEVPACDLERHVPAALADHVFGHPRKRVLFLVDGLSLWGSPEALTSWLYTLACGTAGGSELLLNLLDPSGAVHLQSLRDVCDRRGTPKSPEVHAVDGSRIGEEARAQGLELLHVFDSRVLQRVYLGVEDLFTRELYGWMRVPDHASPRFRPPLDELVAPATPVTWPGTYRPQFGRRVDVCDDGRATPAVRLRVTRLRACEIALGHAELTTVNFVDGTRTVADIETLATGYSVPLRDDAVSRLLAVLRAHGFLRADPLLDGDCDLGAVWNAASDALRRNDVALASHTSSHLAPFRGNVAVSHLRTLLRDARSIVFVRDGNVFVVAALGTSHERAQMVAVAAGKILQAIVRVLDVQFENHVVVDLSSARSGVPVTMVADAEPYTVVRIPSASYSRATLCHELTHVVAMCRSAWLSEGLAVWMQRLLVPEPCFPDDIADDEGGTVDVSLEARLLGRHDGRAGEIGSPIRDRRFYRSAGAFVDWLIRRSGVARFSRFFASWRSVEPERDSDAACRAVGLRSLADLEDAWRRSV